MNRRIALGVLAVSFVGWTWSPRVEASNASLPRTPVVHQDETCLTVVDPAIAAVLHLPYTIPSADTCRGDDELPDSRTHQFLAWCRTWPAWQQVPHWLTSSDVERAVAGELLPAPPPASDVVEGQAELDGCLVRIDADDARRPIHCTTAIDGVDWDVAAAPPGAWVVYGYTFDPPQNLWVPRRGVVKIEGAGDPPAVALARHATVLGGDAPLALEACVDAPAGSTLRASWAVATGSAWTTFAELADVGDGTFALELPMPDELAGGGSMALRVEVVAPDGGGFVYDSPDAVTVVDAPVSTAGATTGTPFDFCVDNPDALEPQPCGADGEPSPGCACTGAAPRQTAWIALLLLGALKGRCTRGRARGTTTRDRPRKPPPRRREA